MALMKIICTDDERKRLSMTHIESSVKVEYDGFLNEVKPPVED